MLPLMDPFDVGLVNCGGCDSELLGAKCAALLSGHPRKLWPMRARQAGVIHSRISSLGGMRFAPFCRSCVRILEARRNVDLG